MPHGESTDNSLTTSGWGLWKDHYVAGAEWLVRCAQVNGHGAENKNIANTEETPHLFKRESIPLSCCSHKCLLLDFIWTPLPLKLASCDACAEQLKLVTWREWETSQDIVVKVLYLPKCVRSCAHTGLRLLTPIPPPLFYVFPVSSCTVCVNYTITGLHFDLHPNNKTLGKPDSNVAAFFQAAPYMHCCCVHSPYNFLPAITSVFRAHALL